MEKDPKVLEEKACDFLVEEKYSEAFTFYKRAANAYKGQNKHKQAALCFASAASCWSKKSGEKIFYSAAKAYEQAALEATKTGDLEYASLLYKYAAINYERDRELINFSECFYKFKECYRKFLTYRLLNPKKIKAITKSKEEKGIKGALKRIFTWLGLTFSFLVWGHGERPARTIYSGIFVIILAAIFYSTGHLIKDGQLFQPSFWESLYFSVITFTTVGYGDFTPLGLNKLVATIEAFSGLLIIPIFVIGLSRKYLSM
ncbi:MAG: hypothetical protein JW869_03900 [Candidatus Omnitrophica bacterium]|nr:hypothetical protein [Candidatus Omnitrophota bacterium]